MASLAFVMLLCLGISSANGGSCNPLLPTSKIKPAKIGAGGSWPWSGEIGSSGKHCNGQGGSGPGSSSSGGGFWGGIDGQIGLHNPTLLPPDFERGDGAGGGGFNGQIGFPKSTLPPDFERGDGAGGGGFNGHIGFPKATLPPDFERGDGFDGQSGLPKSTMPPDFERGDGAERGSFWGSHPNGTKGLDHDEKIKQDGHT